MLNRIYSQPYHSSFPAQEFKNLCNDIKDVPSGQKPVMFYERCGMHQKRLASVATISGSSKDSGITQIREGLIARG
jgi:hypothetical protein